MTKIPAYIYFFVIGGIIALVCGYIIQDTFFFQKNAIQVIGTVKDFRYSNKGGCSPNVSYRIDGKDYVYQSNHYTSPCPYDEGETVNMLYISGNPKDAMLDSFTENWLFVVIFGVISIILLFIGSIFWKKEQRKQWLIGNGLSIQVPVEEVAINYNVAVNSRHPWIIIGKYDDGSGNVYIYKSENIWFDPSEYVAKTISVFVNPTNYKEHHIDISFLPKLK